MVGLLYTLLAAALMYLALCFAAWLLQERFIFVPTFRHEPRTQDVVTPNDEVFLETPGNGLIHGLFLYAENPRGVILYLHGNTGGMRRWKFIAEELCSYGFTVFIPDYRGYGLSKGKRTENLMHSDTDACLSEARKRFPGLPVIVYGRSLGSGFAVKLAAEKPVNGLVLETPFLSLLDVANSYFPFLPNSRLIRFPLRSDLRMPSLKVPTLILHGTADIIVPYRSALALFHAADSNQLVKMTTIPGGRHNNLNIYPLFREKLAEFLSSPEVLRPD